MGKPDQIVRAISGKLPFLGHYGYVQAKHSTRLGLEKVLDPVLVFIRGKKNLFEFVERRYFEHFGRRRKIQRDEGAMLITSEKTPSSPPQG